MNTNEIMRILYEDYAQECTPTPEYSQAVNTFCNNPQTSFDNYVTFSNAVDAESCEAFKAGFHTAVSLIMGGAN